MSTNKSGGASTARTNKKTTNKKGDGDSKAGASTNNDDLLDRNVLEAFDLETKLRKTIYDILQPIGNKLADVERRVMEMQHSLVDKHEKRLFELEFCLFKTERQPTIFE